MDFNNLLSLFGIFGFIGIAWVFSTHRKSINWRIVTLGIIIQLAIGLFVFVIPQGREFFWWINTAIVAILDVSTTGTEFLFGNLAKPPGKEGSLGFFLAFQTLPSIIFFSALMSLLYFVKIMPWIITKFAHFFSRLLHISGAESMAAASNIFVGVESALTIKPHLPKMTKSELCTVLTAGMATVASNVLAFYVFTLQDTFPTIAGHLVSASIISAPAAIVFSKILYPETGTPLTMGSNNIEPYQEPSSNLFEAVIEGSKSGLQLITGIAALLIAVLGLVALLDLGLEQVTSLFRWMTGSEVDFSLKALSGYLFYPFVILMGVPLQDAFEVSKIIGERLIVTEFVSYMDLAQAMKSGSISNARSLVITSYALCGFAHFASLSIFIGGVSALAPERTKALSEVGLRALFAATLACLMTGCIAGLFFNEGSILFA